jgi:diguanylate cyclase (GGDEF)-like protein/PAS domain S-box-containing protein
LLKHDQPTKQNSCSIEEANLLQAVINAVPTPIFFKDHEGRYLGCNLAFEDFVGLKKNDLIGKGVFELFSDDLAKVYYEADAALYNSQGKQIYEAQVTYADGSIHDVMFHKACFHAQSENIYGIVGAILDITDRKKAEAELEKRALTDSLTGLQNRYSLLIGLEHALKRAERMKTHIAFLMLDLDDFKHINDTYGHFAGDSVLTNIALRLRGCVRESDMVARLGGDEFVIVIEDFQDEEVILQICDKIIRSCQVSMFVDGHDLKIGITIGVAYSIDGNNSATDLMKMADIALYRAKDKGKSCYQFFSRDLKESVL